ncbi:MAG: AAA family ATPase [Verrucomicrobia bacterium]|nr:AAA family ATPase [Verrucomicrobiota bacterium]
MSATVNEYLPRPGEFDPLADYDGADIVDPSRNGESKTEAQAAKEKKPHKPLIEFYSPSQLKNYVVPADQCLVGDFHLQRGAPSVLAGPPGCGKSRATLWLGVLGAQGSGNWFGMPVRCRFKTLIVQSENGLTRLHRDFEQIPNLDGLDDWLRISAFPSYRGFEFANPYFRADLKAALRDFGPQLVIVDPWNACVRDSMEKDFLEGFERLREVMAEAPDAACLILHHLRKPRSEDRHKGRSLANLLSGSYVLVSMARSVMVMQPASDDTEDARVVLTPAKNNDGELGKRTAWTRKAGWFEEVEKFDFEEFDGAGGARREPKVNEGHLRDIFEDGRRWCVLKVAASELEERAGVKRSAAYEALKLERGRFSNLLTKRDDGLIGIRRAKETNEGEL